MRIRLDAKVRTKDGQRAGRVQKVLWDPAKNEVDAFVISTGGLLGHDVLISREVLERATAEGDELVVDLTKDELEQLEHYEEDSYIPPPLGWPAPVMYDYPASAYVLATTPAPTTSHGASGHGSHEHHEPEIRKGMRVRDASGKEIGQVQEVLVDDTTGELRAIVVAEMGPLGPEESWEIAGDHLDVGADDIHVIEEAATRRTT